MNNMNHEHLTDQLDRPCKDLRISVTNRCQFRCRYCLPAEHIDVMRAQSAPENNLSFDEITATVKAFAAIGVNKVRLTGGEPLLRKNLSHLIRDIKAVEGIDDIALTTNGALLPPMLDDLIAAGLDRITISLDAIDDQLFKDITGTKHTAKEILDVIELCNQSNIKQVKINTVVQKGVNEHQVLPILNHFRGSRVVVRFIEFMDVGNINQWQEAKVLTAAEVLKIIEKNADFHSLSPTSKGEVAKRYGYDDGSGEFGLIASISQPFCSDCNRARLSSDGQVYTCLFAAAGQDLKPHLADSMQLNQAVRAIWQNRSDQYSTQRLDNNNSHLPKIEMFVMGG